MTGIVSQKALVKRAAKLGAGLALLAASSALAGVPPRAQTPKAVDAGPLATSPEAAAISVTLSMRLRDANGAEDMLRHVTTPGDALYRQYLTPADFNARFGPADSDIAAIRASMARFGLTTQRTSSTTLRVTGAAADIERAFQVSLHRFEVAAQANTPGYAYRAPLTRPTLPADIAAKVPAVFGLDTRPTLRPHLKSRAVALRPLAIEHSAAPDTPDAPGLWTVLDFADYYNVNPLYAAGLTGKGRTIGIATLASFTPNDAFIYWRRLKLKVDAQRIKQIEVDGGSGPPSDVSGSDETTLDVEQSGGIAPGANLLVYEAPNTNQGFVDLFAKAVDDDLADAISCSWGEWEIFSDAAYAPVTDPVGGQITGSLQAFHQIFLQGALQGQTMTTAAGDAGAYDANDQMTPPDYSLALSVDSPGSDSAITSAGGTTLPGKQTFKLTGQPDVVVNIKTERVWGWDYLVPLCTAMALDPISCGIFPVGGGGGVSVAYALPDYQKALAGVHVSQPNQVLLDEDTIPPTTIYTLPAKFAGRNVPDVSLNADPYTGYTIGYTSSASGKYGVLTFAGGTSFVAPQLAGITQLLDENAGKRIGFLNPILYRQARLLSGYLGAKAPLHLVEHGNNDFYRGGVGYNPGAGVGTLNVANLAAVTKK